MTKQKRIRGEKWWLIGGGGESGAHPRVITECTNNKLQFYANNWKTGYIIVCKRELQNCKMNSCQIIHQFLPREYYIFVSVPFWHFLLDFLPLCIQIHTNYTQYITKVEFLKFLICKYKYMSVLYVYTYILKSVTYLCF